MSAAGNVAAAGALASFPADGLAVVVGASGGLGSAFAELLRRSARFVDVMELSRRGAAELDITAEASVAVAAGALAARGLPIRLVVVATGLLHGDGLWPERSWRDLDPSRMARAFAVNTIGPAMVMKHFLPLLAREGKAVLAALSARVGSIGDNRLGGWYSYRASKAGLNQLAHTASIELRRRLPEAICVVLHPGTVATRLSSPFAKDGFEVQSPMAAVERLLAVIDGLGPHDSGVFLDHRGEPVPW